LCFIGLNLATLERYFGTEYLREDYNFGRGEYLYN